MASRVCAFLTLVSEYSNFLLVKNGLFPLGNYFRACSVDQSSNLTKVRGKKKLAQTKFFSHPHK
jgi:hypothetical protein